MENDELKQALLLFDKCVQVLNRNFHSKEATLCADEEYERIMIELEKLGFMVDGKLDVKDEPEDPLKGKTTVREIRFKLTLLYKYDAKGHKPLDRGFPTLRIYIETPPPQKGSFPCAEITEKDRRYLDGVGLTI